MGDATIGCAGLSFCSDHDLPGVLTANATCLTHSVTAAARVYLLQPAAAELNSRFCRAAAAGLDNSLVRNFAPACVGVSSLTTSGAKEAQDAWRHVKEMQLDAVFLLGVPDPHHSAHCVTNLTHRDGNAVVEWAQDGRYMALLLWKGGLPPLVWRAVRSFDPSPPISAPHQHRILKPSSVRAFLCLYLILSVVHPFTSTHSCTDFIVLLYLLRHGHGAADNFVVTLAVELTHGACSRAGNGDCSWNGRHWPMPCC